MSPPARVPTVEPAPASGRVVRPASPVRSHLGEHGYREDEYFVSGTAARFEAAAPLGADGRWSVHPGDRAPYRTRILVRRPADPGAFNGTVLVEWLNVSGGVEAAPDWSYLHPWIMAAGCGYVACSAQAFGVEGGRALLAPAGSPPAGGLKGTAPGRYGSLVHPGDAFSYDLVSGVGRALRGPDGDQLLGGPPRRLVALGESQSAFFLTTYVNAVAPVDDVFDGFFIHSRGGTCASLDGRPRGAPDVPEGARIRDDLRRPVFVLQTETELGPRFDSGAARQPDSDFVRTWEVAGTAHADAYLVGAAAPVLGCDFLVNDGPHRFVARAAIAGTEEWVRNGTAPAVAPRLELATTRPPSVARDRYGIALGGLRTPDVDVPVATLSGEAPAGADPLCGLFGSTVPFGPATLAARYGDRGGYLAAHGSCLDGAIAAGSLLEADRAELEARARAVEFA